MSFKDIDEECVLYSKSDNTELMIYEHANEVIEKKIESLLNRYELDWKHQ